MVKLAKVLSYMPFGGNSDLWKLRYDVEDDRFLRIFGDIAKLIRRSEKACEDASKEDEPDYRDLLIDAECEYLEELIGASFLILQTKIRRVTKSALELRRTMLAAHQIDITTLPNDERIHNIYGPYKGTPDSQIKLIWEIGNYYKHRDEWCVNVWEEEQSDEKKGGFLRTQRQTRRCVEKVGIVFASTGNLRTAYEFFGIQPYSNCKLLAEHVQTWATKVHETAYASLELAIAARRQRPRRRTTPGSTR